MKDDLIRRGDALEALNKQQLFTKSVIRQGDALEAWNKQQLLTKSVIQRVVMQVPAVAAVSIEEYEDMKADRDNWMETLLGFSKIAREVVMCKDCRMAAMLRKPKGEVIADCMLRKFHTDDEDFIEVRGDDFCSNGVRRE